MASSTLDLTQRWDRGTPRPHIGSRWVWEPDKPHARANVVVDDVRWNGEEWWVYLRNADSGAGPYPNEAARFWEAVL